MDFLNSLEKKYIPSIHKFRYQQRKARVNSLKQKCKSHPQQLTHDEIRVTLRVLKHYNLLPITKQYKQIEKKFMFKAGEYFLYSSVLAFSPFLLREFYKFGFIKRSCVMVGLFVSSYWLMMRGQVSVLNQYNRKMVKQNIHKFHVDLQDIEDQQQKNKEIVTNNNKVVANNESKHKK